MHEALINLMLREHPANAIICDADRCDDDDACLITPLPGGKYLWNKFMKTNNVDLLRPSFFAYKAPPPPDPCKLLEPHSHGARDKASPGTCPC